MTASSAPHDSGGHSTPTELWETIKWLLFEASGLRYRCGLNLASFPRPIDKMESSSLVVALRCGSFGEAVRLWKQGLLQRDQLISELRCPCYHVEIEQDDRPFMIHKEDKNPQGLFYTLGF